MNADLNANSPGCVTRSLAILSVATFWMLPFSPFIAMAAVSRTNSTTGWPRTMAVAATFLCAVYTVVMASCIAFVYFFWMPVS